MYADHMPWFTIKPARGSAHLAKVNYFAGNPENQAQNDITEGEANARLIAASPDLFADADDSERFAKFTETQIAGIMAMDPADDRIPMMLRGLLDAAKDRGNRARAVIAFAEAEAAT